MSNFYLKGFEDGGNELYQIQENFLNAGIEVEPFMINYDKIRGYHKKQFIDYMMTCKLRLSKDMRVNLICQSVGCHLGITLASAIPNLEKIVVVEPRFQRGGKSKDIISSLDELKNDLFYFKTMGWAQKELKNIKQKEIPILCICSDPVLEKKKPHFWFDGNLETFVFNDPTSHPLFDGNEEVLQKIKQFIR